ncbi:hypothetical protein [Nitrosospira sp. NRS527]|uniref:hypothetical protein n=1 Tax=Nitrosospira sp. NRS527 TaxID=155925 RepID=UPI001FD0D066|nr:hypothetical protein [Nitrosospira sp. NRS527]
MVSQTTLVEAPADLKKIPHSFDSDPFTWMFREDSFDPVSRIRRGRLFQKLGNQGWESVVVEAHPAIFSEIRAIATADKPSKSLSVYAECTELLNKANRGEGMRLAIGVSSAYSLWRIVQTEYSVNRDILVTLRSESAFGILPDIDTSKIHPGNLPGVQSAIDRVLNAAYRELPSSVVDQCRNAATVIISRWMHQQTNSSTPAEKDLGDWIKVIENHFKDKPKVALCSALKIINRLHPRGKDNEKVLRDLRQITEDDAELTVYAIGFIIREIRWDRNS